jgi:hypothetical protein
VYPIYIFYLTYVTICYFLSLIITNSIHQESCVKKGDTLCQCYMCYIVYKWLKYIYRIYVCLNVWKYILCEYISQNEHQMQDFNEWHRHEWIYYSWCPWIECFEVITHCWVQVQYWIQLHEYISVNATMKKVLVQ